jgi:hypothetical protein
MMEIEELGGNWERLDWEIKGGGLVPQEVMSTYCQFLIIFMRVDLKIKLRLMFCSVYSGGEEIVCVFSVRHIEYGAIGLDFI